MDAAHLRQALDQLVDPYTSRSIMAGRQLRAFSFEGSRVTASWVLPYPAKRFLAGLTEYIRQFLLAQPGVSEANIQLRFEITAHTARTAVGRLPEVKNIIAVASGKGGVGKSTTALNLALGLLDEGARVGLVDADIYGPSQPVMLGATGSRPEVLGDAKMQPVRIHGLQTMSIGYLIDPQQPAVWRGPMVTQALMQLVQQTAWESIDYLVIDLPPGTGDIPLSLAQRVPLTGVVVVTTPQELALIDARKAIGMFEKVQIPILGVVENMSTHQCLQCGHTEALFGEGGGAQLAAAYGVELLGQLPLEGLIRLQADQGVPMVVAAPDSAVTGRYRQIAMRLALKIASLPEDFSFKIPPVVMKPA